MTILILFIALAIVVSFYCSLLESAFLSLTPAYVRHYQTLHHKNGLKLVELKKDVDRPLAAVLSLNTVAHTLGATGAGAQAIVVFGNEWIGLFSGLLTFAILILSEVIPKTLGALYWRRLTGFVTRSLSILIIVTYPLVWVSVQVSKLLQHGKPRQIMRSEIRALAEIGKEEGVISSDESAFIQSLLQFRDIKATDVMTPISVVASVNESDSVTNVLSQEIPFSRIPVYKNDNQRITGYVLKDDLHEAGRDDQHAVSISAYKREIYSIAGGSNLLQALKYFTENRSHIAVVNDAAGMSIGIITLEDTVETLLGWEIIDEFDPVADMRELANESPNGNGLLNRQIP